MPSKIETVRALMRATAERDDETFLGLLTDDIEYHYHVGSRPLIGKEWVRKFLNRYREITAEVTWRIDKFAETENEVFVEGYEEYLDTRSNDMIAHPYMGIFEFRDGKIFAWRDYFEMDQKKGE
jgi:limonene-1,2-epoxide hydrolase